MKKTKLSKRVLAVFLSMLMVLTTIPAFTAYAQTAWNRIAYSNFTEETETNMLSKDGGDATITENGLSWFIDEYTSMAVEDSNGLKINDGYMYLTGNNPVNSLTDFKITVNFRWFDNFDVANDNYNYGLFELSTNSYTTNNGYTSSSNFIGISANGNTYVKGKEITKSSDEVNLSTAGTKITAGEFYTLNVIYLDGVLNVYVTDSSKSKIITLVTDYSVSVSGIQQLRLGDDNNSYYSNNLQYKEVDFYENQAKTPASSDDKFLFAYFTGDDWWDAYSPQQQAIRFATSTDGINFTPLNNNDPVVTQTTGTTYCRDPYLFQGNDGAYYMIATDMDCNNWDTYTSEAFVIWRSTDLINWSETNINVREILGESVYKAWAPEVIWDDTLGAYMVYFALQTPTKSLTMYYMTTTDLLDQSKYSSPTLLYQASGTTIDGDIVKQGDTYYMFYKDESDGRKTICLATASAVNGPYTYVGVFDKEVETGVLEGCEVYTIGDDYYLMADRFGDSGNFAIYNLGSDLSKITPDSNGLISTTDDNPITAVEDMNAFSNLSVRHGSILHISSTQYNILQNADFNSHSASGEGIDLSTCTLARYLVNDSTTDEIGDTDLTKQGNGATWKSSAFKDGSSGAAYFTDGNYLSANISSLFTSGNVSTNGFSVSFYGKPTDTNAQGRFFEFNNMGIKGDIDYWTNRAEAKYVSMTAYSGSNTSVEVCSCYDTWGSDGKRYAAGITGYNNSWHHYVVTFEVGKYCIYIDGSLALETSTTAMAQDILDALCSSGTFLLGQAGWPDTGFIGYMRDFRIYNKAFTSDEAVRIEKQYELDKETDAKAVVKKFETLMSSVSSTKAYTNMAAAYDAYVELNKAIDEVDYGQVDIDLAPYSTALQTAIDNMKEVNSYTFTGTAKAYWYTNEESGYYSNVLYCSQNVDWTSSYVTVGSSDPKLKFKLASPANSVLLYDGTNDSYIGLKVEVRTSTNNSNKKRYISYMSSENTAFNYRDYWTCVRNQDDYNQWIYQSFANDKTGYSSSYQYNSLSDIYNLKDSSWFWYNKLYLNSDTSFDSNYYVCETPKVYVCWNGNTTGDFSNTANVYAINYKPIKEKLGNTTIQNNFIKIANAITSYKYGGASTYFDAFDAVIDPNSYFSKTDDSSVSSDVSSLASFISNHVSALNNLTTSTTATTDDANYQALRTKIDNLPTIDESLYTSASVTEYKNVLKAAHSYFASVLVNSYPRAKADIDSIITAIDSALVPLCDTTAFNESKDALNTKLTAGIYDSNGKQIYTLDSWNTAYSTYSTDVTAVNKYVSNKDAKYTTEDSSYVNSTGATVSYTKATSTQTTEQNNIDSYATALNAISLTSFDADTFNEKLANLNLAKETLEADITNGGTFKYELDKVNADKTTLYNTIENDIYSTTVFAYNKLTSQSIEKAVKDNVDVDNETASVCSFRTTINTPGTGDTNNAYLQDCTIGKFGYQINDDDGVTVSEPFVADYGYSKTFTVPDEVTSSANIYKWEMNDNVIYTGSNTFNVTALPNSSDSPCTCYLSSATEKPDYKTYTVTMKNSNNKVAGYSYVSLPESAETVDIYVTFSKDDDTDTQMVTIGSSKGATDLGTYTLEKLPYYQINGIKIAGKTITTEQYGKEQTITLSGNADITLDLIACSSIVITPQENSGITIKVNSATASTTAQTVKWNDKITVTYPDASANTVWYMDNVVVGEGASYTFYATSSTTVSYVAQSLSAPVPSMSYFEYDRYRQSAVVTTSSFALPTGWTANLGTESESAKKNVYEAGIILKTDRTTTLSGAYNGTAYTGDTTLDDSEWWTTSTVGKYTASKITSDTHQYMISISRTANTPFIMGGVAYVKYKDADGVSHTVYSSQKLIAFQEVSE